MSKSKIEWQFDEHSLENIRETPVDFEEIPVTNIETKEQRILVLPIEEQK